MLKQVFKKSSLLIVASMFAFSSCQEEATVSTPEEDVTSQEKRELAPVIETDTENDENLSFDSESQEIITEQVPEVENPAPVAEVRLNPPHGQPGHDCAIPVGDPLPAAGSAGTTPAVTVPTPTPAPQNISVPNVPANANTAVRINPPHGEPGHDCAVPVGQPLN